MPGTLILTRHGQSEWNELNLFTGWKDPDLTALGKIEAQKAGQNLVKEGLTKYDIAFTSDLKRAQNTLDIILDTVPGAREGLEIKRDQALNERDYGELTGLNKDDARKKFGEEQVHIWRRSFDIAPPGGESLKLTAERVLPYYTKEIKPLVVAGKTVLVAAHGNSLRALIMELEGLSGEEIVKKELATGVPYVYTDFDASGKPKSHKVLE